MFKQQILATLLIIIERSHIWLKPYLTVPYYSINYSLFKSNMKTAA